MKIEAEISFIGEGAKSLNYPIQSPLRPGHQFEGMKDRAIGEITFPNTPGASYGKAVLAHVHIMDFPGIEQHLTVGGTWAIMRGVQKCGVGKVVRVVSGPAN